jgi:3',5'-nucleoside bisphosphate phosphatase
MDKSRGLEFRKLDLHPHTHASRHTYTPEAIMRAALDGGMDAMAVTDHNTAACVSDNLKEAHPSGV